MDTRTDLDPQTDLSFTRDLDVPPELVWECWTQPEHIPHFFVPHPHRVTDCQIDLRPGGRFNTTFDVDGAKMQNQGVWLEIVEGRRLVFTDAFSEGWKPAADPFMTAIIEIADNGRGGTRYTATARHRSAESRQRHEDMGFFEGWGTVADQLEAYARTL
ncbi:SRPBCC family protein [Pararhodobacter sp. SW119]|uniref:SRPBCC family protein n=1 Tax=Pararhodobacter sp. SW119 TaxID=2780075 RepID=UPI001ADEF7AD|nr:SRPBCC family protein [Pararhodobacter sp. SW119]